MGNYFTDIVFKVDAVLLFLAAFLIADIFFYEISRIYFDNRRIRKLQAIKKNVYRVVLTEKELSKKDVLSIKSCSLPIFLDVATNRVKEGVFFNEAEQQVFKKICISEASVKKALSIADRSFDKWRRIEAMLFLGYAGVNEACQILKKSLLSKDEDVSYFALLALGQVKNMDSAKALLEFLRRKPGFRYKTASLLGQFPKDIAPEVIKLAGDKDYSVRFWAPQIISGLNDQSCIDKISGLLKDKYPEVRASACQCLGAIGDKSCVSDLKKCLNDESWFVKEAAMDALEKILGEDCIPLIIGLIKDNSWVVIDRLKKILAKNITGALAYIQNFLTGDDELTKKISIEIIQISGCIKELYEGLLAGGRTKTRAAIILKVMMSANAKGLGPELYSFSNEAQKQIQEILGQN